MVKKLLFTAVLGMTVMTSQAQLNATGDGFTLDNSNNTSQCHLSGSANNGGIGAQGHTIVHATDFLQATSGPLRLTSQATFAGGSPTWFSFPVVSGAACKSLYDDAKGIDMSSNGKVTITAKSSVVGAVLNFYIGGGGQWSPNTSTYNTGSFGSIVASHTFTTANATETINFDLATIDATEWASWAGKSNVQSYGFVSGTTNAVFDIETIKLGTDAESVTVVETCSDGIQNQDETGIDCGGTKCSACSVTVETCSDGIKNQDETGIDCGGATCSPCSTGGGGGGTSCAGAVNDHGHGTWYNNLDVNPNGVVKCSFNRDDILGTKYGAMDKGLLLASGTPDYCGMCVEAIAPTHNNTPTIIQIVDECPDCWDRDASGNILTGTNTKFGDIDLSIAAFQALLQQDHVALGIGDFDWKEVSCPWANNIQLIIQGSNDWYAKVIIANHVNRVASVEISNDGGTSWHAMTRLVDNGWDKGSFGPDFGKKSFKITDIHGNEIIMSDITMSVGDATIQGTEQFPACGTVTSTNPLNTLEYVTAFPNPANSEITFVGIEDVQVMEIIDMNGQVVASNNLQGNSAQVTLDISDLAPGLYVAKMSGVTNTGTVNFVKQ